MGGGVVELTPLLLGGHFDGENRLSSKMRRGDAAIGVYGGEGVGVPQDLVGREERRNQWNSLSAWLVFTSPGEIVRFLEGSLLGLGWAHTPRR